MWSLCINSGLHAGSAHELKPGNICIGSADTSDILVLDEVVPPLLAQWKLDDQGTLNCAFAAPGLQFSYDGDTWSDAIVESLFSVNLYYRFADLSFTLVRAAVRSLPSETSAAEDGLDDDIPVSVQPLGAQGASGSGRWLRPQQFLSKLSAKPRWLIGCAGLLVISLLGAFWMVAERVTVSTTDVATGKPSSLQRRDGLLMSYQLSIGHQAPPGFLERDVFDRSESGRVLADGPTATESISSAGSDTPDPSSTLKISRTLTMGKPVLDADKLAEPALFMLQERLEKHAWGSRVIVNARGNHLSARANLSESERREFERVTQQLIREYGNTVSFRAVIEPLDPPTQLAVKQVLGGGSPVVILEDGSRLMQGSIYDGKLVESITTDRIVLRGKDRVEIPI